MKTGSHLIMGKGLSTCLWLQFILTTAAVMSSAGIILDKCMAPDPCNCTVDHILCHSSHLTEVPTFTPTTTHTDNLTILLPANDLTVLPANAFRHINTTCAKRITILFQSNKLYKMDIDAFAGIENAIVDLQLQDNRFTELPAALTKLTRLERLHMQANPITNIDPLVTTLMSPSLKHFAVFAVNLTSWPYGVNNLRHLSYLGIDNMPFHRLPLDSFNGFGELTELRISGAFTGGIPSSVCFLRNLKVLSVNRVQYQSQQQLIQLNKKCRELLSDVAAFINL
ncbi:leucine-rich repeat transmembrane protein FLRT1-like [Mya arenaria]|nr:leucine-rich repeat transmembrane protein FLRT1-like isoform X2 [Mya arenaria]XP_052813433.1 leucine-rich repeat transmembrane protein FLRT1-like [Mya arenaria]XP_052813434.1 leucine-rich repeat transmembrane protein FLRT1-like [Mya arenaria]